MKKTEQELNRILVDLRENYLKTFGEPLPEASFVEYLTEEIKRLEKKFILLRTDGLDPLSLKFMIGEAKKKTPLSKTDKDLLPKVEINEKTKTNKKSRA